MLKKKKSLGTVEKVKLEENVIKHLLSEKNRNLDELRVNPKYSNTVYKFVIQKFNERYSDKLNESQKKLLSKYVVSLGEGKNQGVLKSAIQQEVIDIKFKLRNVRDKKIRNDPELMKKLNECYKQFSSTNFESASEQSVLELLQFMSLVEEVSS